MVLVRFTVDTKGGLRQNYAHSHTVHAHGVNMSKIKIRCKVSLGMFDSEFYVLVNGSAAYYVHRDNVYLDSGTTPTGDDPVNARVLGYLIAEQDNKSLVQLPGEVVVGGIRTWVESSAVTAA
jgi:hypothetical protein